MQDFTGVPCIVDLATMREAVSALGGDPEKINPLAPAELVIDHSVIADLFGTADALERNVEIEYERNGERYQFLRWGQTAFDDFKVVPPGTGIVHQVNIEYLARVTYTREVDGVLRAYPDTSSAPTRTPRWSTASACSAGASAASRPRRRCSASPSRCSSRASSASSSPASIPTGVTATDVVLTITDMLRKHGVVGKFVEFYGDGVGAVPLANRATIGNMSPEFGSTAAMFPIDDVTLDYLRLTGRSEEQLALVEAYSKQQHLWHDPARRARLQRVPRARPLDCRSRRSPVRSARRTGSSSRDAKAPVRARHRRLRERDHHRLDRRPRVEALLPGLRPRRRSR